MTGMLWFDNDPKKSFEDRLAAAVTYYQKKYGAVPDCCLVHPDALPPDAPNQLCGVAIEKRQYILPNHFLIGRRSDP